MGELDPRRLRPADLARLLNSTPLGAVIDERQVHRHRVQAGARVGDAKTVHLVRYAAWLFGRVQEASGVTSKKSAGAAAVADPAYERMKEASAQRNRQASKSGRDIGPPRPCANPERRAAAAVDFRRWCETYFASTFRLGWSADHLRVLARAQQCVLHGGQFALAMPRASGKTSIAEAAALWAVFNGHRRFVTIVGASETAAHEILESLVVEVESNDLLDDDYNEICGPIRALEGIANRCAGQLSEGRRTQIVWTQTEIVLPTMAGSVASAAIVKVAGITGRVRGMKYKRPDGVAVRPDLVLVDDPQTDESARSLSQCATRERILSGAVLGLAGPATKIAALMPCTVIRPGDMADNILDRQKHPEWNGERTQLIYALPESKLWDRYAEIRAESLRRHGDIREATEFYRKNRAAMDAGAEVAWEHRFQPDELSAVQNAMNLKLQDEAAFWAEYQNKPLQETGLEDAGLMSSDQIAQKLNGYKQGIVPLSATHLTAFIDVQQKLLYWAVCAWDASTFTGQVVDYGGFPDQRREYFSLNDAQHTLALLTPGAGMEAAIYAGLEQLAAKLLGAEWQREDKTPVRVARCLVDASWGNATDVVYQFCRQSAHAALLLPSHGRYVGPAARPFEDWAKKPGDQTGSGWLIPGSKGKRAVKHVLYDTNQWKTFVHSRLAVAMGDPGCLSLFGRAPARHRMIGEHLTSETRKRMQGPSRVMDVWALRPGARDNHLLDCVVGAAVAASTLGVALKGMEAVRGAKPRPRVRFRDVRGGA